MSRYEDWFCNLKLKCDVMGEKWSKKINYWLNKWGNAGHHVLITWKCKKKKKSDIFTSYWWWSCLVSLKEWFIINCSVYYGIKWQWTSMSCFNTLSCMFHRCLYLQLQAMVSVRGMFKNRVGFRNLFPIYLEFTNENKLMLE